jgi:glutathione S-transferase
LFNSPSLISRRAASNGIFMLTLRTGFGSPFGRKARIAVSVLGLERDVKIEPASNQDEADPIRQQNPLGKVPVLLLDDGTALFDSPVILEYLDHQAGGGRIIPREPAARFATLRLEALCDGILEAMVLQVYEGRWRAPEHREPKWVAHQAGKVARGLQALEPQPPRLGDVPDAGQITLACTLGYGDMRFSGEWRKSYPNLRAWLDDFAGRIPSFAATAPP